MDFASTLSWLGAFAQLMIGFSFVIFVHELGHFLAAKWTGIKVTQFALFFGPSIFSWRKGIGVRFGSTEPEMEKRIDEHLRARGEDMDVLSKADAAIKTKYRDEAMKALGLGETEYRVNWVPLGGYVKMLGQEDMDPSAQSSDPRAFNRKPVWARAVVISAGVIMNLIFGVLFFVAAFMHGVKFNPAVVGAVDPSAASAKIYAQGHEGNLAYLGLKPGDRITHVDGEPVGDFGEMAVNVALTSPGERVNITVKRPNGDGTFRTLTFVLEPAADKRLDLLSLGIDRAQSTQIGLFKKEKLPEPFLSAGVKSRMRLVEVDGTPVGIDELYHVDRAADAARGEPITLKFAYLDPKEAPKGVNPSATATFEANSVAQMTLREIGEDEDKVTIPHLLGMTPATKIEDVVEGSPAEKAGLKAGDYVTRVGGVAWPAPSLISKTIGDAKGRAVHFAVLRDGEEKEIGEIKPTREGTVGIHLGAKEPVVGGVLPESPAAGLGMRELIPGSKILAVNGQRVTTYTELQRALQDAIGTEAKETKLTLTVELNAAGTPKSDIELTVGEKDARELLAAGWTADLNVMVFDPALEPIKADNPLHAAQIGISKTGQFMVQTYLTIARLFQGTVKPSHLQGPIGIADAGTRIRQEGGFWHLLWFLGLISANLAVINFLPIPVVDGGLMTLLIIEKLKGSPVSAKVQVAITYVGLALILSLFLYVTYNDITRIAERLF